MSNDMQGVINLIRAISGQANILTIPRVFVDLTGDLKAALFLSQCIYWSSRSSTPGVFYKTYQEWEKELALSRYEIDQCRKRVTRWVKTELRQVSGTPVLHYSIDLPALANDLLALLQPENDNVQTIDSQMDLRETSKSICKKLANPFVENSQIEASDIKGNLTETTLTETTAEINSNGFAAAAERSANRKANRKIKRSQNSGLPSEIQDKFNALGWRGSLADVETAWREDPERVRQWLWYAGVRGWSGALLRTVLRNAGEYPPELDPGSEYYREQQRHAYISGKYAEFIEH
ncbi:hypothetical protein ATHL_01023 [Anaerolinea thermolimosa]|uniref:hypothetical protein n=1 Tax=Anaerolinea thermolimosa TaxID=229919 RepID=UPI000785876B|nr:hypothetical protein [Anaerolinea thermolimosa]GAP06177.1 hypothetical protein ATHL_01023 [Anaerolinea thermolimosa]